MARMNWRPIVMLLLLLSLGGCGSLIKRAPKKKKPDAPEMKDVSGDVAFQAFLGRLRKAAESHDPHQIASMMTEDFAFVLGATPGEDRKGEGVFQYWDEKGIWPELEAVLRDKFVPKDNYMVAPPQFAADPDHYAGYRAGIAMLNGSWKFVYFVAGN